MKAGIISPFAPLNLLLHDLTNVLLWSSPKRKSLLPLRELLACWGSDFVLFCFCLNSIWSFKSHVWHYSFAIGVIFIISALYCLILSEEMVRKLLATSLFTKSGKKNHQKKSCQHLFQTLYFLQNKNVVLRVKKANSLQMSVMYVYRVWYFLPLEEQMCLYKACPVSVS